MNGTFDGSVSSADGVEIGFSARGAGSTSLVFIHGGLADRSFWDPQLASLGGLFRVVAIDLAGHYPMLEQPDEFNRLLIEVVRGLPVSRAADF